MFIVIISTILIIILMAVICVIIIIFFIILSFFLFLFLYSTPLSFKTVQKIAQVFFVFFFSCKLENGQPCQFYGHKINFLRMCVFDTVLSPGLFVNTFVKFTLRTMPLTMPYFKLQNRQCRNLFFFILCITRDSSNSTLIRFH